MSINEINAEAKESLRKYFKDSNDVKHGNEGREELTKEEIEYFVKGYTEGTITDYQAAALIMAIFINGMSDLELYDLTFSMANSGEVLDLSIWRKCCR